MRIIIEADESVVKVEDEVELKDSSEVSCWDCSDCSDTCDSSCFNLC